MMKQVSLEICYRLINHGPTVIIGTRLGDRRNLMAAAWVMPISTNPPKIVSALGRSFSRELIEATRQFSISVPPASMIEQVYNLGTRSGRQRDKLAECSIEVVDGSIRPVPLVEGCIAWLECEVSTNEALEQDHNLFIARIVNAWADDSVFDDGHFTSEFERTGTLHHVAGGRFVYARTIEDKYMRR